MEPISSTGAGPSNAPAQNQKDIAAALTVVRDLVQHVGRAFYETRQVLLLDQLMRKEAMKDEELAGRLGITTKELAKVAHILVQHQLVMSYSRNELKPGAQKASARVYYYFDYRHTVNVIKWRMWKLGKSLDEKQRNVLDGQGYVCPTCKATYSTLDYGSLVVTPEGFLCEICSTSVVDNDNAEEVQKNKDRMQRFNSQSQSLVKCMQKADKVTVPPFDIVEWLVTHVPLEDSVDKADGLAIATGGAKEAPVTVQLAQAGDEAVKRRLKEAEIEAKRKANALPVWISQSTVTGDLTRAGVREGIAVGASSSGKGTMALPSPKKEGDVKPTVDGLADDTDLDAYFAAMQGQSAAEAAPAVKRSPSAEAPDYSRPQSVASSASTSLGVKRSRTEHELDEGYGSVENLHAAFTDRPVPGKKVRVSAESSPVEPVPEVPEGDEEEQGEFEVSMVSVGGMMIVVDDVTPEVEAQMTADEYTAYADIMMSR